MKKVINNKNVKSVTKKTKGLIKDFKSFAIKGNIIDLATGVIIGTAFTKIVNSLVSEIITPAMSLLTGKIDISSLFVALSETKFASIAEAKAAGVATINYGLFLSSIIDFVIVAFTIFLFLRYTFKKRQKTEQVTKSVTKECPYCLSTIPEKAITCAFCTKDLVKGK